MNELFTRLAIGILLGGLASCSSSSSSGPTATGDAQTPPTTNGTDVEAWIKGGAYKSWHCEPAPHAARAPSPHFFDRVCSNAVINAAASNTTAAWPKGAAAVKELFSAATDPAPSGYAVYVKTQDDGAAGANWYWYERVPNGTMYADGFGGSGDAKANCVPCHGSAGADAAHTTSPGGHDFVYTPIP
jgi:hypothetical protein